MLPKKAIVAIIVASLLYFGYESLSDPQTKKTPNVLLGFALVSAVSTIKSLKELVQVA